MGQFEVELLGDLVLRPLDDFAVEFDQFATAGTDQVIVMLMVVVMLVATTPIAEPLLPCQSALTQKFEGAVDGGVPDRWILLLDQMIEILGTEMALCPEKDQQYELPLGSLLQSCPPDMLEKYLFLLNEFGHGNNFNPRDITTIARTGKLSSPHWGQSTRNTGGNRRGRFKIVEGPEKADQIGLLLAVQIELLNL